eukprot:5916721-Prymnesium_polylepis.1
MANWIVTLLPVRSLHVSRLPHVSPAVLGPRRRQQRVCPRHDPVADCGHQLLCRHAHGARRAPLARRARYGVGRDGDVVTVPPALCGSGYAAHAALQRGGARVQLRLSKPWGQHVHRVALAGWHAPWHGARHHQKWHRAHGTLACSAAQWRCAWLPKAWLHFRRWVHTAWFHKAWLHAVSLPLTRLHAARLHLGKCARLIVLTRNRTQRRLHLRACAPHPTHRARQHVAVVGKVRHDARVAAPLETQRVPARHDRLWLRAAGRAVVIVIARLNAWRAFARAARQPHVAADAVAHARH